MAGYESREPWSAGGVSPKPVILTQTTPLVERACLKSGLTFDELIAPFVNFPGANVEFKLNDTGFTVPDVAFRVLSSREFRQPPQDVVDAVSLPVASTAAPLTTLPPANPQHIATCIRSSPPTDFDRARSKGRLQTALAAAGIGDAADARAWLRKHKDKPLPWFAAWRRALDDVARCQQHEMFDSPVGIITAVSSGEGNIVAALNDLTSPHHLPPSFAAEVYDSDLPRAYLLLHDMSEPGASREALQAHLSTLTTYFPRDVCFALVINSAGEGEPAPPATWAVPMPPKLFTHPSSVLAEAAAAEAAAAGAPWSGPCPPPPGYRMAPDDVARMRQVMHDIVKGMLLPAWQRSLSALYANVTSHKRGLRNTLRSWLRGSSSATTSPRARDRGKQGGAPLAVYTYGTLPAQTRLLADSLYMLGALGLALQAYKWAGEEFRGGSTATTLHQASVAEMIAWCLLRQSGPSREADGELEGAVTGYYNVAKAALAAPSLSALGTHASLTEGRSPMLSPFSHAWSATGPISPGSSAHALTTPAALALGAASPPPTRARGAARDTPTRPPQAPSTPTAPTAGAGITPSGAAAAPPLTLAQLLGEAALPSAAAQPSSGKSSARTAAKRQAIRLASRVAALAADTILARGSRHTLAAGMLRRTAQAEGDGSLSGAVLFEQAACALLAANTATSATLGMGSALAAHPMPAPSVRKHAFFSVLAAKGYSASPLPSPQHALRCLAVAHTSFTPQLAPWPVVDGYVLLATARCLRSMADFASAAGLYGACLAKGATCMSPRLQGDVLLEFAAANEQWRQHLAEQADAHEPHDTPQALEIPGLPRVDTASLKVVSWDNALHALLAVGGHVPAAHKPTPEMACLNGLHNGLWGGSQPGEGAPRALPKLGWGAAAPAKCNPITSATSGSHWLVWPVLAAGMQSDALAVQRAAAASAGGVGGVRAAQVAAVINGAEDDAERLASACRGHAGGVHGFLASPPATRHAVADVAQPLPRRVGQPFAICVTLHNPLSIPLHLYEVHAVTELEGGEEGSACGEGGSPPALAGGRWPTGLSWRQTPGACCACVDVELEGGGSCTLRLLVVPTAPGDLTVSRVAWTLAGTVRSGAKLQLTGPLLHTSRQARARRQRGADARLQAKVAGEGAWLAASLHLPETAGAPDGSIAMCSGEVIHATLRLTNCGQVPCEGPLRLRSDAEGAAWLVPTDVPEEGVSVGLLGATYTLTTAGDALEPGGSMDVPVMLRAGGRPCSARLAVLVDMAGKAVCRWGSSLSVTPGPTLQGVLQTHAGTAFLSLRAMAAASSTLAVQGLALCCPGDVSSATAMHSASRESLLDLPRGGVGGTVVTWNAGDVGQASTSLVLPPSGDCPAWATRACSGLPAWEHALALQCSHIHNQRSLAVARSEEAAKRAGTSDALPMTLRAIRLAAAEAARQGDSGASQGSRADAPRSALALAHAGKASVAVFLLAGHRTICLHLPLLPFPAQDGWAVSAASTAVDGSCGIGGGPWHHHAYLAPQQHLPRLAASQTRVVAGAPSPLASHLRFFGSKPEPGQLERMVKVELHAPASVVAADHSTLLPRGGLPRRLTGGGTAVALVGTDLDKKLLHLAPPTPLQAAAYDEEGPAQALTYTSRGDLLTSAVSVPVDLSNAQGMAKAVPSQRLALVPLTVHLTFSATPPRSSSAWSQVRMVLAELLLLPQAAPADAQGAPSITWISPLRHPLPIMQAGDSYALQVWAACVLPRGQESGQVVIDPAVVRIRLTPAPGFRGSSQRAAPPVEVSAAPSEPVTVSLHPAPKGPFTALTGFEEVPLSD